MSLLEKTIENVKNDPELLLDTLESDDVEYHIKLDIIKELLQSRFRPDCIFIKPLLIKTKCIENIYTDVKKNELWFKLTFNPIMCCEYEDHEEDYDNKVIDTDNYIIQPLMVNDQDYYGTKYSYLSIKFKSDIDNVKLKKIKEYLYKVIKFDDYDGDVDVTNAFINIKN